MQPLSFHKLHCLTDSMLSEEKGIIMSGSSKSITVCKGCEKEVKQGKWNVDREGASGVGSIDTSRKDSGCEVFSSGICCQTVSKTERGENVDGGRL